MTNFKALLNNHAAEGTLEWIGLRPAKKATVKEVKSVQVNTQNGLEGDRYKSKGKRQVTLIQAEHIAVIASLLKKELIKPETLRRNLVVKGINLLAFSGKQFRIGTEVILEMTGPCHPCSRMEQNLGEGGLNAMRGHGGITTKVIQGGQIKIGDPVRLLTDNIKEG